MPSPLKEAASLIAQGRSEEALVTIRDFQQNHPDDYNALVLEGGALQRLGNVEAAAAAFVHATKIDEARPHAWKGLSKLYRDSGKLDAAVDVLSSLVQSLDAAGQRREAQDEYQRLSQLASGAAPAIKEKMWLLELPDSPLARILILPPAAKAVGRLVHQRQRDLQRSLSSLKSRSRMNIAYTPDRVSKETLQLYNDSDLARLLVMQIDHTEDDNSRHQLEAQLLELQLERLRLSPANDKPPLQQTISGLVDRMVLFEPSSPLAYQIHWDWSDVETFADFDIAQLRTCVSLFPLSRVSRAVHAVLYLTGAEPVSGDEWVPQEIAEMLSDLEESWALGFRIAAAFCVRVEDWTNAVDTATRGLRRVRQEATDMAVTLSNTETALLLSLATAYVHFQVPRNFPLADELFDKVLASDPNCVDALVGKGRVLAQRSEWDAAIALLNRVIDSHPTNGRALSELAWCNVQAGRVSEGISQLQSALQFLEKAPDRAETRWRIGWALWHSPEEPNRAATAFEAWVAALQEQPAFAPAYTWLGIFYDARKDRTRATKCWYKALELDNGQVEAGHRLATIFADNGQWDLVQVVASLVIEKSVAAWPFRAMGIVSLGAGDYGDAVKYFQRCLRIEPGDANSWVGLGEAYIASGRYKSAEKALKWALKLSPDSFSALYALSRAQRTVLDFPGAAESLRHALDRTSDHPPALVWALIDNAVQAAYHYLQQSLNGDALEEAIFALAEAEKELRKRPDHAAVWDSVAAALGIVARIDAPVTPFPLLEETSPVIQRVSAAEKALEVAKSKTERAMRHFNAAVAYHALDSSKEATSKAVAHCRQAVALSPRHALYWRGYGVVVTPINAQVAQHCFVRSLALDDRDPQTWAGLGGLYTSQGDYELASDAFDRALSIDPDCVHAWIGQALVDANRGREPDHVHRMLAHSYALASGDDSLAAQAYGWAAWRQSVPSAGAVGALYKLTQARPPAPESAMALAAHRTRLAAALALERRRNYTQALEIVPEDEHVHVARLLLGTGQFAAAVEEARQALETDGDDLGTLLTAGLANYSLHEFDNALDMFSTALQIHESDAVLELLVQVLHASGIADARQAATEQLFDAVGKGATLTPVLLLGVVGLLDGDQDVIDAASDELRQLLTHVPVEKLASICRVLSALEGSTSIFQRAVFDHPGRYDLWRHVDARQALVVASATPLDQNVLSEAYTTAGGVVNAQRAVFLTPGSLDAWSGLARELTPQNST